MPQHAAPCGKMKVQAAAAGNRAERADGCGCCFSQDVDTIYHSQDNREFNLLDFSHLESR